MGPGFGVHFHGSLVVGADEMKCDECEGEFEALFEGRAILREDLGFCSRCYLRLGADMASIDRIRSALAVLREDELALIDGSTFEELQRKVQERRPSHFSDYFFCPLSLLN